MRFRTRYIGPSLSTASALGLGRKASMIRNRSRLARLNQLASHDYGATIHHNIGQFPLSDSTQGGNLIPFNGVGNNFMLFTPTYVFLGGFPILAQLSGTIPQQYTDCGFTAPSLTQYYTFLGLPTPTLGIGQSISVSFSIGNSYGMDYGDLSNDEKFEWFAE